MELRNLTIAALALVCLAGLAAPPTRAGTYDPGASDTEIKIGQTIPYSGPASAYSVLGKVEAAYFAMLNKEKGGINGRKLHFMSLDDGYSPPKTVEQVRRLVEQDHVLLMFNLFGTATNTAVQKYLNKKKVPQLFVSSGASKFGDPRHFPWTMGWAPTDEAEGRAYARYVLAQIPDARVGILYQNDDFGRDFRKGFHDALGGRAKQLIVAEQSYENTDPTLDSQIIALKASGATVFFNVSLGKFASQAIRKAYEIDWHPVQFLPAASASIATVLAPAGLEKAKGIISKQFYKDPTDPEVQADPDYKRWAAFMKTYRPHGNLNDFLNVYGYLLAGTLEHVLLQCGDDLTRENVMRQAASIKHLKLPMMLDGTEINTGPDDYHPIKQIRLVRFDGHRWQPFGGVVSDSSTNGQPQ